MDPHFYSGLSFIMKCESWGGIWIAKLSFCKSMQKHLKIANRVIHFVNHEDNVPDEAI